MSKCHFTNPFLMGIFKVDILKSALEESQAKWGKMVKHKSCESAWFGVAMRLCLLSSLTVHSCLPEFQD